MTTEKKNKENSKNKERFALWIYPELMREVEHMVEDEYAKSKSDFIGRCIEFYIAYLKCGESLEQISPLLSQNIHEEILHTEKRLSEMLFKLAVEVSKIAVITAYNNNWSRQEIESLNKQCAEIVSSNNGIITVESQLD